MITAVLVALLAVMTFYAFRFALIIARMEEQIELALDDLDRSYTNIGRILERPLFFDSPEVRSVLNELGAAQRTILRVANEISKGARNDEKEAEAS